MKTRERFSLIVLVALCGIAVWIWARSGPDGGKYEGPKNGRGAAQVGRSTPVMQPGDEESKQREKLPDGEVEEKTYRDPRVAKLFEKMTGERGKLSREVIEAYLEKRGRSAASLIAAWKESEDVAYLREGLERYPDDPAIHLTMAFIPELEAERAEHIAQLKKAPGNTLGNWLAAYDAFEAKQPEEAVKEILGAVGKWEFQSYTTPQLEERRVLYESSGFEHAEAQLAGFYGLSYEALMPVSRAAKRASAEVAAAFARGDAATARKLAQAAIEMGQFMARDGKGTLLMEQLMGRAIEIQTVRKLDAASATELLGESSEAREKTIKARGAEIGDVVALHNELEFDVSHEEMVEYMDRVESEGELAAMRWMEEKRRGKRK